MRKLKGQRLSKYQKEDRTYLKLIFRPSTARLTAPWWFYLGYFFFPFFLQVSMTEFILAFGPQRTSTDLSFAGNIASQWVCCTLILLQFLEHRHLLGVEKAVGLCFF